MWLRALGDSASGSKATPLLEAFHSLLRPGPTPPSRALPPAPFSSPGIRALALLLSLLRWLGLGPLCLQEKATPARAGACPAERELHSAVVIPIPHRHRHCPCPLPGSPAWEPSSEAQDTQL